MSHLLSCVFQCCCCCLRLCFRFLFLVVFLLPPSHFALLLLLFSFTFDFTSFSSTFLRIHIGTSPSTWRWRCLPPPSPLYLSSSISLQNLCLYYACTLERHRQCVWDSVCHHLFPFTLSSLCSLLCLRLILTSHPFHSASDSHSSTAHSRCDEFFVIQKTMLFRLQLRCLDIRDTWEIHVHMFWSQSVRLPIHVLSICLFWSARVVHCVSCKCSIWGIQFFLRNLSSASMAGDIITSRPLKSFFNVFADLTNVSLSSLSANCKNACVIGLAGHLIWIWSVDIPIVVMISFSMSCTSCSVVSSWNPATTAPLWFWSSCEFLPSMPFGFTSLPLVFGFLQHGHPIFHSGDFSFILLYLSSQSSFIFLIVVFNPAVAIRLIAVSFHLSVSSPLAYSPSYSFGISAVSVPFSLLIFLRHCVPPFWCTQCRHWVVLHQFHCVF